MKTTKFLGILFGIFALLCGLVVTTGSIQAQETMREVLNDRSVDLKSLVGRSRGQTPDVCRMEAQKKSIKRRSITKESFYYEAK